jgi:hypothetical protein
MKARILTCGKHQLQRPNQPRATGETKVERLKKVIILILLDQEQGEKLMEVEPTMVLEEVCLKAGALEGAAGELEELPQEAVEQIRELTTSLGLHPRRRRKRQRHTQSMFIQMESGLTAISST